MMPLRKRSRRRRSRFYYVATIITITALFCCVCVCAAVAGSRTRRLPQSSHWLLSSWLPARRPGGAAFLSSITNDPYYFGKINLLRAGGQEHQQDGSSSSPPPADVPSPSSTGTEERPDEPQDEERYSRQVYALGAKAHGRIRSSTVYVDGPCRSGLVYECVKNLVLSGIRELVVVVSDHSDSSDDAACERRYHNAHLDDLGCAYQTAARAELMVGHQQQCDTEEEASPSGAGDPSPEVLLVEYAKRLNPSVHVSTTTRSSLSQLDTRTAPAENAQPNHAVLLAVDRPVPVQTTLNKLAREIHCAFVSVETAGVFGRVFCDFGSTFEVHDEDGENPLTTPLDHVERIGENEATAEHVIIHCVEGEKHDVSKGDLIHFQQSNGEFINKRFVVLDVQTPFRFVVEPHHDGNNDDDVEDTPLGDMITKINEYAVAFCRIKMPRDLKFEPLERALEAAKQDPSLYTACDLEKSFDSVRRDATSSCFEALPTFLKQHGRFPVVNDMEEFSNLARKSRVGDDICDGEHDEIIKKFLRGCPAKFAPFQAVFSAIAAQEALKAVSGLYNPIRQFLLYDCDEVLPVDKTDPDASSESCDSSDGLRYLFGSSFVKELRAKRVFVVGAGAIGCEILKNLAAMGVGTIEGGKIVTTDMDTIEKSNLSRQLLFRDADIGKFKSTAANEATLRFNPAIVMEAHSSKVGSSDASSHTPFDDDFWSAGLDVVLNALDNLDARLFIDAQCVANKKALVDAGTMGAKGNVQVIVPHKSESYASSVDPPEPAIPVCTLKNFPYAISHTIQWGRDLFDGLFYRRPNQANDFRQELSTTSLNRAVVELMRTVGEDAALKSAEELREDLGQTSSQNADLDSIRSSALQWASTLASRLFCYSVDALLLEHPLDSEDEDGEPFWSGTRRPPSRLIYTKASPEDTEQEVINQALVDFVSAAARLRMETYVEDGASQSSECCHFSVEEVQEMLLAEAGDERGGELDKERDSKQPVEEQILLSLKGVDTSERRLNAVEFEKDDDANGHVSFVTAASNLRAISYGIPPVDAMETRRVAGAIIPAMITTTAFVSALSCIEFLKLAQDAPLKSYRNSFINLALPFFAFTVPVPAEATPGLQGKVYTIWDHLSIQESKKAAGSGGIKLRTLLRKIKKTVSDGETGVSAISFGPYLLFASFLHEDDEYVMSTPVWDLLDEAVSSSDEFDAEFSRGDDEAGEQQPQHIVDKRDFVDLKVVVEDFDNEEEVELPVRLLRYKR